MELEARIRTLAADHCVATWNGTLIQIWRLGTTATAVRGVRRVVADLGAELVTTLVIIEKASVWPDAEARSELAKLGKELSRRCACVAVVHEGDSFGMSIVRSIMVGLALLVPRTLRFQVFGTVEDATRWAAPQVPSIAGFSRLPAVVAGLRSHLAGA